jgi:hypothetical protein
MGASPPNFCTSCGLQLSLNSKFCPGCGSAVSTELDTSNKSTRLTFNFNNLNKPAENNNEMPVWLKQGIFWFALVSLVITLLQAISGGGN